MHEFSGRTAVITGGASGIGLGVARRLAAEGMNLVLADIEAPVLTQVVSTFEADGVAVLGIETDVSDRVSVLAMRDQTIERFGTVEFLFNNAGVAGGGALLAEADDYEDIFEWTLGVNLFGVLHCIRAFVPGMIAHGQPAHVINTASMAGLIPAPLGAYTVSKYSSLCMAELLAGECAETAVNVSVLCPAFVATGIADSVRNLPEHLVPTVDASPEAELRADAMRDLVSGGIAPEEVAEAVFAAVVDEQFLILTHEGNDEAVRSRTEALLAGRVPYDWVDGPLS